MNLMAIAALACALAISQAGLAAPQATAAEPATGPVTVTVTLPPVPRPISPYIYGTNQPLRDPSVATVVRMGGNRITAYNWENNASNAGADWHHQSDGFVHASDEPARAVLDFLEGAQRNRQAAILSIPMAGFVAADKLGGGDVNQTPDFLNVRFHRNRPAKNAPFAFPPDVTDRYVFQDELVHFLEQRFPHAQRTAPIWYALCNEPDLWDFTHARIRPERMTYREMIERTVAWSTAIRAQARDTLIFGFVSYGWNGYKTLQDAPDAAGRQFLTFFLQEMAAAERRYGQRLIDVVALHWYPETRGGGLRVTEGDGRDGPAAAARVQAPRHLYDPAFREESWIDRNLGEPIHLIPRILGLIRQHYPGTKYAITEYNYGGSAHISGAIAQADVLGAFGREGVFAANLWRLGGDHSFTAAAFELYRNYDGQGSAFGDSSLDTASSDLSRISAWAALRADGVLTLVLINRAETEQTVLLDGAALQGRGAGRVFRITGERAAVVPAGVAPATGAVTLPAMSASLLELPRP